MAIPADPLPPLTEDFSRAIPEQYREELRVTMANWIALAAMCDAQESSEKRFGFLTAMHCILAHFEDKRIETFLDAYERGANFQHALSADSYTSGAVDIARMLCEQHGWPVPQWITLAAAQLAARQEAMVAAVQASAERRALAAFVQESPVH